MRRLAASAGVIVVVIAAYLLGVWVGGYTPVVKRGEASAWVVGIPLTIVFAAGFIVLAIFASMVGDWWRWVRRG